MHRMLFFPLMHVKMPTIVGILTSMSGENFMLNLVQHETSFITSGPDDPACREKFTERELDFRTAAKGSAKSR